MLRASVTTSTQRRYAPAWQHWCTFISLDQPPSHVLTLREPRSVPHSEIVFALARFMHYLASDLHMSHTNIGSTLAGLRHEWKSRLIPTAAFDDPSIIASRRAYRLDLSAQPVRRGARAPLTWEMLQSIVQEGHAPASAQRMVGTACLLAFCCLFRVSEVSVTPGAPQHCISASAVEFRIRHPGSSTVSLVPSYSIRTVPYSHIEAVRITQHTAKNRASADGAATSWFSVDHSLAYDPMDLPRALYEWSCSASLSPDSQFFSLPNSCGGRYNLSSTMLSRSIKRCARCFGLDPSRFDSHSLRIGGATALRAHGVAADAVQRAGRWRSLPVSLSYPAPSTSEQDLLLNAFRSPSRYTLVDLAMSTLTPKHVPVRRSAPHSR